MKLTTRLLCFFLVAIAVVLLAFDGVLFGLAAVHLDRQVNERIDRALATLCAACEVHTDTVEWEPEERAIHIVPETGPDRFCWTVRDLAGKMVDCSMFRESSVAIPRISEERFAPGAFQPQPAPARLIVRAR